MTTTFLRPRSLTAMGAGEFTLMFVVVLPDVLGQYNMVL